MCLQLELHIVSCVGNGLEGTYDAHSLGAKRFTPACTEASMSLFWMLAVPS
jgi:hypothetical protein